MLIAAPQTITGIDQQEGHISFINGLHDLTGHRCINTFFTAINTAGINHNKGTFLMYGFTILTISGQPGKVGHQRIPAMRQPVEQG